MRELRFHPLGRLCRQSSDAAGIIDDGRWNAAKTVSPITKAGSEKGICGVELADGTRTSLTALHFASAGATLADNVKTAMIWYVLGKCECSALAVMYAVVKPFERRIERRERWKGRRPVFGSITMPQQCLCEKRSDIDLAMRSIRQVCVQRLDGRLLTDRLFTARPMMIKCIVSSCMSRSISQCTKTMAAPFPPAIVY